MSWLAYGVAADGTRTGLPVTAESTPRGYSRPVVHLDGQVFDRVEVHWADEPLAVTWTSGPVIPLDLGGATVGLLERPDGNVAVVP